MENTEKFTERAENYVKYRPHYPPSVIPFLKDTIGLLKNWKVADVGAGTGISAELFLENGNLVYAVEPNASMRKAAEERFGDNEYFISIPASAEATSLPSGTMDLICVGQALHWFDTTRAKEEFQRIASCGAHLVLLWNERKIESDFLERYEELLFKWAPLYDQEGNHRMAEEKAIHDMYTPHLFHSHILQHTQYFTFESLKGLLLSCSYAPLDPHPNYKPMISQLEKLFDQFSNKDRVEIPYSCKLYYGKIS